MGNKGGDPFDPFATITSDPSSPDVDPFGASYPAGHSILEPSTDQLVDQNQSNIDFFGTIDYSQEQDQIAPDLLSAKENVNKDLLGDFLDDSSSNDMEVQLNGDAQVIMNGEMIVTTSSEMSHVEHSSSSSEVVMETRTETTSSSSSSETRSSTMTSGSSSAMVSGSSSAMTSGSTMMTSGSSSMTSGSSTMTMTEGFSSSSEMRSETAEMRSEHSEQSESSHITESMMQQVSEASSSSSGGVKPAEEKKALDYMKQFYTGEKGELQREKIIRAPKKLNIDNICGKNIEEENKKEVKSL